MKLLKKKANGVPDVFDAFIDLLADRTAKRVKELEEQESNRLLTVPEAARYLGRSPHAVRSMIAKKFLPKVQRDDNRVFLDRADLDRWIEMGKS